MGSRGSHRQCVICGLRERHKGDYSGFFASFPQDENRCREWVKVIGNEDLVLIPIEKLRQLRHVCGAHFEKRDLNKKKNRTKRHAVPKLNLTAPPLTDVQMFGFPMSMASAEPSPSQRALADTSNIKTNPAPEVAAIPSTSGLQQSIAYEHSPRKRPLVDITNIKDNPAPEVVAIPCTSGQQHNIAYEQPPRKKALVDTSNIQVNSAPEVVIPSTSGLQQNIAYELSLRKGAPVDVTDILAKPAVKVVATYSSGQKRNAPYEPTPKEKKLMMELRKTKCSLRSLKKSAKLIEELDSDVLKEFVMAAYKNQKKKPQGRRWTPKNKISALAIYKRSPSTYRYMAHTMPLPSVKTLQNLLKNVPMETGINKSVLSHLTTKSQKKRKQDKLCCLLFDEIALKRRLHFDPTADKVEGFEDYGGGERTKEMADHALVFMLQGVREKFKMPLAYYFTKGTVSSQRLAIIIKEIVAAVKATGYQIIATVCDQGPTNMGALNVLKAANSPEEMSFFSCGDDKIFTIFDIPHLFKSIRNNFYNHGVLVMGNKKAKWSHLVKMEEKNRSMLYLTTISKRCVEPKYRAKMKVKLAAQLLSRKVSAILKLMAEAEHDPKIAEELMQTAEVVFELNKLFDFSNGPSGPSEIIKGIRENVSLKTEHLNVWTELKKKLHTLKFENINGMEAKNVKCVQGYITTLSALQDLWHKLRSEGFEYLNLRQLNQDSLENLFGVIRQHSPTNRNPTCSNFVAALKTSIISRLTAPHSRGSNCEKDFQELLTDFHDLLFKKPQNENECQTEQISEPEETMDSDFLPILSIPDETEFFETISNLADLEQQPIVYVSGYIAAHILKGRSCGKCEESLKVDDPEEDPIYSYIRLREWWQNKRSLTYPTIELCRMIETAVKIFETEIVPCLHYLNICKLTVTLFFANCDATFLKCDVHRQQILDILYFRLACLLIRRQCQRINQGLAMKEEALSDAYKKAQQYGSAK